MGDVSKNNYAFHGVDDKHSSNYDCSVMISANVQVRSRNLLSDVSLPTSKLDFEQNKQCYYGAGPAKKGRRKGTHYSKEFIGQFIQELLRKNYRSVAAYAREKGVNKRTAQQWLKKEKLDKGILYKAKRGRPPKKPANSASVDATTIDATTIDATTIDATTIDATTIDATTVDATTVDATTVDAVTADAVTIDDTPIGFASIEDTPGEDFTVLLSNGNHALSYDAFIPSANNIALDFSPLFRYSYDTLLDEVPRYQTATNTPRFLPDNDNASIDTFNTPVDNAFNDFFLHFGRDGTSFGEIPRENATVDFPLFPSDKNGQSD